MTFEQEIKAIEEIAASCRNREQANNLLAEEVVFLKEDNARLSTALEHRTEELDKTATILSDTDNKLIQEARNNGELKATLKQLLAEQMALASRAAEMLRSLEEKPEPKLTPKPELITIEKPNFGSDLVDAHTKDQEERLLERHVVTTLVLIAKVPSGEEFVLDAPYGKAITDWLLKKWYRRIIGKAPMNYKNAPSIKLRKLEDGRWEYLSQTPKLVHSDDESPKLTREGREPLPFRPEETNTNGDAKASTAFGDDGKDIPSFLMQGPNYADQGRQS